MCSIILKKYSIEKPVTGVAVFSSRGQGHQRSKNPENDACLTYLMFTCDLCGRMDPWQLGRRPHTGCVDVFACLIDCLLIWET